MKKILASCLLWIALVNPIFGQNVFNAGFAFVGDFSQNEARYPFASRFLKEIDSETKQPVLEMALGSQIKTLKRTDVKFNEGLGETGSGDSLAIAFALTEESIEEASWGSDILTVYRVIAQILIFDITERKVIANFPAMAQYQNVSEQKLTLSEHEETFRKIYLDDEFGANIFKEWVGRLESVPVKPSYKNYLKVSKIEIDEAVKKIIPSELAAGGIYEAQTAQILEFYLGSIQQVPMVPYTKGQAIGAKIPARFANGDSYQLQLPDPDYAIEVLVRPFKHIKKEKSRVEQLAFGAFITLTLKQPDFNKIYVQSKFKNINIVSFPKSEEIVIDHWFGYQQSLRKLFSDLATQISNRDKKVLSKMTKTENIKKQLQKFEEILDKCR